MGPIGPICFPSPGARHASPRLSGPCACRSAHCRRRTGRPRHQHRLPQRHHPRRLGQARREGRRPCQGRPHRRGRHGRQGGRRHRGRRGGVGALPRLHRPAHPLRLRPRRQDRPRQQELRHAGLHHRRHRQLRLRPGRCGQVLQDPRGAGHRHERHPPRDAQQHPLAGDGQRQPRPHRRGTQEDGGPRRPRHDGRHLGSLDRPDLQPRHLRPHRRDRRAREGRGAARRPVRQPHPRRGGRPPHRHRGGGRDRPRRRMPDPHLAHQGVGQIGLGPVGPRGGRSSTTSARRAWK